MLTDDACERLLSGCLTESESALAPVGWFLEDLKAHYVHPVPAAVRSLHPSATSNRPAIPRPSDRSCKPSRSWWSLASDPSESQAGRFRHSK
ncbi:MAG TPA: hypothetical protein VHL54_04095 [Actinomycetota bacterium]|nr:hypothetical protein [Actinomycetota bacterium]